MFAIVCFSFVGVLFTHFCVRVDVGCSIVSDPFFVVTPSFYLCVVPPCLIRSMVAWPTFLLHCAAQIVIQMSVQQQ